MMAIEADAAHQLAHHLATVVGVTDLVDDQRLRDDVEHAHARVEGAERVLKDVLNAAPVGDQRAPVEAQQVDQRVAVVEDDAAGVGLDRAQDDLADRRLAAAALADDAEAAAAFDAEADVVDDDLRRDAVARPEQAVALAQAKALGEIADLEQRRIAGKR